MSREITMPGVTSKDHEFVLTGMALPGGRKRVYASRKFPGGISWGQDGGRGTGPLAWRIEASMAEVLIVDKDTYAQCMARVFEIWGNQDRLLALENSRPAIEAESSWNPNRQREHQGPATIAQRPRIGDSRRRLADAAAPPMLSIESAPQELCGCGSPATAHGYRWHELEGNRPQDLSGLGQDYEPSFFTKSGRELTGEWLDEAAAEAEEGYPVVPYAEHHSGLDSSEHEREWHAAGKTRPHAHEPKEH
jgi:hypothetical protein